MITMNNFKMDIMAMIIGFLVFLSFCFGLLAGWLMAEDIRNLEKEEE